MIDKEIVRCSIDLKDLAMEYGISFNRSGQGRCPFSERHHNGDANPSLRLDQKKGRIRCFSQGCFGEGGVDHFGLVMQMENVDFRTALYKLASQAGIRSSQVQLRIAGTWDYQDEKGNLLYQVVRKEKGTGGHGKTFTQRHPDGKGKWVYNLKGVRKVLYRLPNILSSKGLIVILEGERCVDALWDLGFPATCNPGGAGKWGDGYNDHLQGRCVVIWPDKDEVGKRHVDQVARSLHDSGKVASIRVVEALQALPEKGDVIDGIEQLGWTAKDVQRVLDEAQFYDPDSTELEDNAEKWREPKPLPDPLPPVNPFDMDLLPIAFQQWIKDISERMQCPPDFPAVGAMVAVSAVVGRQMTIRPKVVDDWQVVPNLWGGVVGRPGLLKTPSLAEVLRPLDCLEVRAREEYETVQRDFETEKLVREARQKHFKDQLRKALREGHDPYLSAQEALAAEEPPPIRNRYRTNDPTMEKLGELLNENPRGMLLFRDELTGFLRTLDREGRESDRAFYLEAWNGTGQFVFDRIGRGTIDIQAACVSVLGGIQPGPLSAYMERAARGGQDDDGLVQRFQLVVWPDKPGTWKNIDRQPDMDARRRAFEVFKRLDRIDLVSICAKVCDEEGFLPYLRFASEAQKIFTRWRTELEHRLRRGDMHPMLESYLAKFRSLIPSLALLIHLVDTGSGPVGEDSLLRACAWGEYLESHAKRVYAPSLSPSASISVALSERIYQGDLPSQFALHDIYRKGWSGMCNRDEIRTGLEVLEDLDWVRKKVVPTGGRTRTFYLVNPTIWKMI